jgi:hypothetical protein
VVVVEKRRAVVATAVFGMLCIQGSAQPRQSAKFGAAIQSFVRSFIPGSCTILSHSMARPPVANETSIKHFVCVSRFSIATFGLFHGWKFFKIQNIRIKYKTKYTFVITTIK